MNSHHDILRELDAYADAAGIEVSTVCRKATGNPRLRERLAARLSRVEMDVERLRGFMAANPPVSAEGSSPASTIVIDDENNVKGGNNAPS